MESIDRANGSPWPTDWPAGPGDADKSNGCNAMFMRLYFRRRAVLLAALTMGTTLQLSACQDQAGLFGLRVVASAFTLPLNQLILQFFSALATISPFVFTI